MLDIRVRVFQNPWGQSVPDTEFFEIIDRVAQKRAEHVVKQHQAGAYTRDSLGLAFLDPTAPSWLPSDEALLATIAIGPEGQRFVPNAIAKAVAHRDGGRLAGYGVYVDLTQSRDGDFAYGYSARVDDTYAGASGQSELQDACEAGHAAVTFNFLIRAARQDWLVGRQPRPRWLSNDDQPNPAYLAMANRFGIYDSAAGPK